MQMRTGDLRGSERSDGTIEIDVRVLSHDEGCHRKTNIQAGSGQCYLLEGVGV